MVYFGIISYTNTDLRLCNKKSLNIPIMTLKHFNKGKNSFKTFIFMSRFFRIQSVKLHKIHSMPI